jgi:signal transduction histidine kinase
LSLAWRILLTVLLLNLAVVGGIQLVSYLHQERRLQEGQEQYIDDVLSVLPILSTLQDVYSPERLAGAGSQVRELIRSESQLGPFVDGMVTSGQPPFEGLVHMNPRGAVHRDPDLFQRQAVLAGLDQARSASGLVRAADGYCMAIRRGGDVVGSLWFRPGQSPRTPALELWPSLLAVLLGTLLFALLLYQVVRRTVAVPLRRIGGAAEAVGAGRYDVQVPEPRGMRELGSLVRSFNAMAARVHGHTAELEQAVAAAVRDTRERERALVLSSRLAAIGSLAAGIAQEINNPIGGMINAVNRLLGAPDLNEKQRSYLGLVQDGLQRISRTSRKVLGFSPRSIEAQRFGLQMPVEGARALAEHRMQQQGVQFSAEIPADLPQLHGDPHEIQQVLLNLFLNSLDALAGRPGGTIAVRGRTASGRIVVEVADNGPGMDQALLARAMDPFFSQKDRPDASGLGLFICWSIVRNHGGEISLESAPGQGFLVRIELPFAPA